MFEKYTERAVAIITTAQEISKDMKHRQVHPEHVLLALYKANFGICSKLFKLYKINYDDLYKDIQRDLYGFRVLKQPKNSTFSDEMKEIFCSISKRFDTKDNQSIRPEHIFWTLLIESDEIKQYLTKYNFNIENAVKVLSQLVIKNHNRVSAHPEEFEISDNNSASPGVLELLNEDKTKLLFENALSKLSTTGYEILGTEQIVQSFLDSNMELNKILDSFGITIKKYNEKLDKVQSRKDEFCDRQIIFTPNAFKAVLLGIETAKEVGDTELKPEHILLGILKNKSGIAYNIIKSFNVDEEDLYDKIMKSIEKTMNETLMILRFAKEEAFKFETNVVGSEMILLGIIIESYGIGARVLNKLGISLKDVRQEIGKIIKHNNDNTDYDIELSFSKRAKKVLELAWEFAQKYNKTSINSEDLLMGITSMKSSVAMQVLTNLGTDVVEIKQGIINELKN